jgi:DNA ligase D-like protein (predicted 3'-phosphoesterase)
MPRAGTSGARAVRAIVRGEVSGVGFREATVEAANRLGALGWVRHGEDGDVSVHAEGPEDAVAGLVGFLGEGPAAAGVSAVEVEDVDVEGHEQFAIRGVSAGVYVVQEHAATAHHFDLRLEVEGVMRSWAVPKGPSMDPAVKRMAIEVEDHSIEHNTFEGPTDGGAVIVWDRGTYDNLTEKDGRLQPVADALADGHLIIALHGQKLSGGYALQRIGGGAPAKWLLIKTRGDGADARRRPTSTQPRSVLSGRTVKQVARASDDDD